MKKALTWVLATLLAFTISSTLAIAHADVNDPGSGCNDQPNGPDCVPDPSEEGQDCLPHGNNEDGNENHCVTTTTTAVTVPPSTTTVVTTTAPPTTATVPPETTTTPSGTTSTPPGPSNNSQPPTTEDGQKGTPNTPGKLAFTGVEDVVPIASAALLLLALGTFLMWRGSRRDS